MKFLALTKTFSAYYRVTCGMSITVGAKIIENDLWMLSSSIALEYTRIVMNETSNNYNAIFLRRSENFLINYDIMIISDSLKYGVT